MKEYFMLIDGKLVGSKNTFNVYNPYNGEVVGKCPIASKEQINEALEKSYATKITLSGEERAEILKKIAYKIEENSQEFAKIITAELGVSKKQALYETARAFNVFMMSAKVAIKIEEDQTHKYRTENEKAKLSIISEPLNLVIGITPFNHPLNQVAHKIAPAIAAGTCMVLKPTEKTPLSALELGKILKDLLPANMINIVTGNSPQAIVDQLITFPMADLVTFTGGVKVGKYICRKMAESGNELVKTVMELGGNAALTILDDANLDKAAEIALGAFDNSGQRCTAIKRILVHENVADAFLEKFLEKTKLLKFGCPLDENVDMGTVINEDSAIEIQRRVDLAIKEGASLILGNKRTGALYSPTILYDVNPRSELVVKETFGPVAPIIKIRDIDHAIAVIKLSPFRLASAVITKNKANAEKISKEIQVGQFSWNGKPGFRTEQAPFGGFGDSGNFEKEGVIAAAEEMRLIRTFYEHPTK
jgi:phosphonoacetaldehyde dehydrogenase